jgi:hypothetical protein
MQAPNGTIGVARAQYSLTTTIYTKYNMPVLAVGVHMNTRCYNRIRSKLEPWQVSEMNMAVHLEQQQQ